MLFNPICPGPLVMLWGGIMAIPSCPHLAMTFLMYLLLSICLSPLYLINKVYHMLSRFVNTLAGIDLRLNSNYNGNS